MIRCPSCGVENKDDAKFCMSCGVPFAATLSEAAAPPPPPPLIAPPPPPAALRRHEPDFMGLVGFALFLFILGIVFAVNPRLGNEWVDWTQAMSRQSALVRPPEGLIGSGVLFFTLTGLSGLVVAGLRVLSGRWRLRVLADVLGAVGSFVFAFLLTFYQTRALTGQQLIATMAAVFGLLLLMYIVIGVTWSLGRWARRLEAERPVFRP